MTSQAHGCHGGSSSPSPQGGNCAPPTHQSNCAPPTHQSNCAPPTHQNNCAPPTHEANCSPWQQHEGSGDSHHAALVSAEFGAAHHGIEFSAAVHFDHVDAHVALDIGHDCHY